jgi:hypothetical protein
LRNTFYNAITGNMSIDEAHEKAIGIRMSQTLYDKIVKKQQDAKKLTGFEPPLSEVARQLIERGLEANGKRR